LPERCSISVPRHNSSTIFAGAPFRLKNDCRSGAPPCSGTTTSYHAWRGSAVSATLSALNCSGSNDFTFFLHHNITLLSVVHRRRNRGGEGARPQLSAYRGLAAFSPPQLEPKIKQLQHIHRPHVAFYMRKLYLMAAPSLMFHFLDSFRRSLLY